MDQKWNCSRFEHYSKSLISPLGSHIWSLFASSHMTSWPNKNKGQVGVGSNIAPNHSYSVWSYMAIICPNSSNKLTKREIRQNWSLFEQIPKSLFKPLGSHIWSLFTSIHMQVDQNKNYVKLESVQALLQIALPASRKSYLVTICSN